MGHCACRLKDRNLAIGNMGQSWRRLQRITQASQPSTQAFSSRSRDLARNVVTPPNGIPHSVTSRHFAPSRVEWVGGERLGTRLRCPHTSPEKARPFTVCSDPSSFSQPKWKWSCSSLYTLSPRGPPVSDAVPLGLSILRVGAWPLLVNFPLTFPNLLSHLRLSPFRFAFFSTALSSMSMGDWAFSVQWLETSFQSCGP